MSLYETKWSAGPYQVSIGDALSFLNTSTSWDEREVVMNTMPDRSMETTRVIVLLCIVLALLALIVLNAISPMLLDFYTILLWLVLGLGLLFMGLRGLRQASRGREYQPWYREPDVLLSAGAFFAVALSFVLHYFSHQNILTDVILLVVFGIPTLTFFMYALYKGSAPMQPQRRHSRSTP